MIVIIRMRIDHDNTWKIIKENIAKILEYIIALCNLSLSLSLSAVIIMIITIPVIIIKLRTYNNNI